jgi:hypothetical protein
VLTGKQVRIGGAAKAQQRVKKDRIRSIKEAKLLGNTNYDLIYPVENEERMRAYKEILASADKVWREFTGGAEKPKVEEKSAVPAPLPKRQIKRTRLRIKCKDHGQTLNSIQSRETLTNKSFND